MARRYTKPSDGRSFSVYAGIHYDCHLALEAFKTDHKLTTSGAVHHLLRQALQLPPLCPLTSES